MTVSPTAPLRSPTYTADGVVTTFDYPFFALSAEEVEVYFDDALLVSGYTVSPVPVGGAFGGSVTFDAAPPAGTTIDIVDNPAVSQERDYTNQAGVYPDDVERALDKLTRIARRQRYDIARIEVPTPPGGGGSDLVVTPGAPGTVTLWGEDGSLTFGRQQSTLVTDTALAAALDSAGFVTAVELVLALADTGFVSSAELATAINNADFVTASELASAIVNAGYVTPSQLAAAIAAIDTGGGGGTSSLLTPQTFGAVGDGIADDTAAVQAWATAGGYLIPPGRYRMMSALVFTKPVSIRGSGMGTTILDWPAGAASRGISITAGASTNVTTVSDLTLATGSNGTGTALLVDYSGNITGGMVQPRTAPRVRIENVFAHGSGAVTNTGWSDHFDLVSVLASHIVGCHVEGRGSGGTIISSTAYRLRGSGAPCEVLIDRCSAYQVEHGVFSNGYEGVFVSEVNFVAVNVGVHFTSSAQEPQLHVHDSHLNVYQIGVNIAQCVQFNIHDNLIYSREDPSFSGSVTGVSVAATSQSGFITNNVFAKQGTSTLEGVSAAGDNTQVKDNTFLRCATGIRFSASGGINKGNRFEACTVNINDAGSHTQHDYLDTFSGNVDNISTSTPGEYIHRLVTGATGLPSTANGPTGSHVRTLAWDGNLAWQQYYDGQSNRQWVRRKAAGTWTPWMGLTLAAP